MTTKPGTQRGLLWTLAISNAVLAAGVIWLLVDARRAKDITARSLTLFHPDGTPALFMGPVSSGSAPGSSDTQERVGVMLHAQNGATFAMLEHADNIQMTIAGKDGESAIGLGIDETGDPFLSGRLASGAFTELIGPALEGK